MIEELIEITKRKNWPAWLARNKPDLLSEIRRLTEFLEDTSPLVVRVWHILNNIFNVPTCQLCTQQVFLRKKSRTYSEYCRPCSKKIEQQNREKAVLDKYGTKHVLSIPDVRKKIKSTNLEKYGAEYLSQSDIIREKVRKTVKQKYGVDNISQSPEIKKKKVDKSLEVFGVENHLSAVEVRDRIKKTNQKRYGASNAMQSDLVKEKNKRTCLHKYGVEFHIQKNLSHEAITTLNSKDTLIDMHHTKKMSLSEIAKSIGVVQTTVSDYFLRHDIEVKHYFRSTGEKELFDFVTALFPSAQPNYRKINGVELDCFIPEISLAIEYNGVYWHSEKAGKTSSYHSDKYKLCKNNGIRLITIFENEWLDKKDLVKSKLLNIFGKSNDRKIYARKTQICDVSTGDKNNFFDLYHIQQSGPSSINVGLKMNDELVACMGFIKHKDYFVLNRYASSCRVIGGFTKLLSYFEALYHTPKIVTFADLRWSEGDLYYKSKFVLDSVLDPDYSWVKNGKVWHKFNWRHTSGLKTLPNYDPNKSETENMHEHGFYRLWDCGKLRFVKNA